MFFLCMMIQFETRIGNRDSKCAILITILIKSISCELKCTFFYSFKASKNTMPLLKNFLQYRKSGLSVAKLKRKSLEYEVNIL